MPNLKQEFANTDGFLARVESISQTVDDMPRHTLIDFASQFYEARMLIVFARFPGKIKWIDRNTVAPQSRPRIERHETKRLCLSRFNHFPDVDAHRIVDDL